MTANLPNAQSSPEDKHKTDHGPKKDTAFSDDSDGNADRGTEADSLCDELRTGLIHPDQEGYQLEDYGDKTADRFE